MSFKIAAICIMLGAFQSAMSQKMHKIDASNSNIRYIGRIDDSNPGNIVFSFPGVSIKAKFQGTAIDAIIKEHGTGNAAGTNYLNIIIDGGSPVKLKLSRTKTVYELARNLSEGIHTVEIFKLTESSVGKVEFQGFQLETGKTLLSPELLSPRKIEFIGNSITCGYGNEVSIENPNSVPGGFTSVNENNYKAWGAITARNLNAQYSCVAYSGRGLYKNNTGTTDGTLPQIYDNTIGDNASPDWNHTRYIPNVIVINLGTNDFNAEASGFGIVDSTVFVNTYIAFISKLRSYYPDAAIICAVGTMINDGYPAGGWTRMQRYVSAVKKYKNSNGDKNVYHFKMNPQLPPYGEDWHPSEATHKSMAIQLTAFINSLPSNIWD